MAFQASSLRGVGSGVVDHRLARRALIREYRKGRLAQHRSATPTPSSSAPRSIGQPTQTDCPICEAEKLVLVTYASDLGYLLTAGASPTPASCAS